MDLVLPQEASAHMNATTPDTTSRDRGRVSDVIERAVVLLVGSMAVGAAVLRTLKPTHAGWFDPTRVDEKVFVLLMVPLLWYLLRIAKSVKVGKDGFEFERLQQTVAETKAATEETGRQVVAAKEQVAVTHAALTYGVGGGKHVQAAGARELPRPRERQLAEHASEVRRGSVASAERNSGDGARTDETRTADENADPQKGRWGGKSRRNGRELRAAVTALAVSADLFRVRLEVVAVNDVPITGAVVFHLHPTFSRMDPVVIAEGGRATLTLAAWGAFTVGAEVDGGTTQLELDLSELGGVPELFASR